MTSDGPVGSPCGCATDGQGVIRTMYVLEEGVCGRGTGEEPWR